MISKLNEMSKEDIQRIFDESSNRREVLRKLGFSSHARNYDVLKRYTDILEIDMSKMELNRKENGLRSKIPNAEVFVVSSSYNSTTSLKKRLIEDMGYEEVCSVCGISEWNGMPISLQLDHMNGVNDDNRVENLRFLCPNCHSQTDTYAGKNTKVKKTQQYCECGNEISRGATLCRECVDRNKRNDLSHIPVSKEELLELIKNNPFTKLGKMFSVSDNAVRKWCRAYGLPTKKSEIKMMS